MHHLHSLWVRAAYAGSPWLYPLYPLGWLWRGLVAGRRLLYRPKPQCPLPLIVVGNFTLGGTGKTPLLHWLVTFLKSHGFSPGIVTRGYPVSPKEPTPVFSDTTAAMVGDEALWLARHTGVPVIAAAKRVQAVNYLYTHYPVDIIVSDDGLQHLPMYRSCEIVLIDGFRRFGNGQCLPAGPLREPPRPGAFHVCHGGIAQAGEWQMLASLGAPYQLQGQHTKPWADWKAGQLVHAVAGIGCPERFFAMLRAKGLLVREHPFPDHHPYTAADLAFEDDLPVLMTEKDAVKCEKMARPHWWAVPMTIQVDPAFGVRVLEEIGHDA